MTGTSSRKIVDAKNIENFQLAIPTDYLLEKFENLISQFFEKMRINTIKNQKLTELRDWLLPMLMNGQVKVGDAEKMEEEKLSMAAEPSGVYKKTKVKQYEWI